jgi:ABC-type transporter Mla MlaB component
VAVEVDAWATVVVLAGGVQILDWTLTGEGRPDLATVDELARLQLVARRLGVSIEVRGAVTDLLQLLALAGLQDELLG